MAVYLIGTGAGIVLILIWILALDRMQRLRGEPGLTARDRILYPVLVVAGGALVLLMGWAAEWRSTGVAPGLFTIGLGALNLIRWFHADASERERVRLIAGVTFIGAGVLLWFI